MKRQEGRRAGLREVAAPGRRSSVSKRAAPRRPGGQRQRERDAQQQRQQVDPAAPAAPAAACCRRSSGASSAARDRRRRSGRVSDVADRHRGQHGEKPNRSWRATLCGAAVGCGSARQRERRQHRRAHHQPGHQAVDLGPGPAAALRRVGPDQARCRPTGSSPAGSPARSATSPGRARAACSRSVR